MLWTKYNPKINLIAAPFDSLEVVKPAVVGLVSYEFENIAAVDESKLATEVAVLKELSGVRLRNLI